MTKLTRNLIIAGSSTAVAGGAAAGIAVAVVKSKNSTTPESYSSKDYFLKHMTKDFAPIYNEDQNLEEQSRALADLAAAREASNDALRAADYNFLNKERAFDAESMNAQNARFESMRIQRELYLRDAAARAAEEHYAQDKAEAEENILAMRERVKAEVWQYARAEYIGCQNAAWREAHKDLIVNFEDSYPMTVLARDWFYLLSADSVAKIKLLEKDMINQIKRQYGVVIKSLID